MNIVCDSLDPRSASTLATPSGFDLICSVDKRSDNRPGRSVRIEAGWSLVKIRRGGPALLIGSLNWMQATMFSGSVGMSDFAAEFALNNSIVPTININIKAHSINLMDSRPVRPICMFA